MTNPDLSGDLTFWLLPLPHETSALSYIQNGLINDPSVRRHRALRHHSQGIFECERVFGITVENSDGKSVPVRFIGEQHVREDFSGYIPTIHDWLKGIPEEQWMQSHPA